MTHKLYIGILGLIVLGCTNLYESIDRRIHPTPEITRQAGIQLLRNGTQLTTEFICAVRQADIVLLYYQCEKAQGWKTDTTVYDVYPVDGWVIHRREVDCYTRMQIIMKAYNNFQRRTQKQDHLGWEIDMKNLIKKRNVQREPL